MTQAKDKAFLEILRKKASGTVAIFDKGDYYKCYEEDALLVANNIFLSDVGLRKVLIGTEVITYLNLNNAQYSKVIKDLLLLLRYRVEVYEEVNGKFSLCAKGVLGNLVDFEEIVSNCVELTELSTLMCARILGNDYNKENHVNLSFCNSQELRIVVAEFNDCPHFPLLEQCIVSLNPRECVLIEKDAQAAPNRFKQLEKALERSNVPKIVLKEEFNEDRNELQKILKPKFKGLNALISHMQLLNDDKYEDLFSLVSYGSVGFMYLSNAALEALEIFSLSIDQEFNNAPTIGGAGTVAATLFDHLNRCRSQSGRHVLRDWMRRPLCDLRRIEERLDVVETLCNCHSIRHSLHDDLLRRVPDIALLARRLTQKKSNLQDCFRLYQLIRLLLRFESVVSDLLESVDSKHQSAVKELVLEPLRHSCFEFERFIALIESTLDIAYCESAGHYRIKPDIDENLLEMSEKIAVIDKKAQSTLKKISSKLNTDSIKLETNLEYGYFFRITLKSEKIVRNSSELQILDTTKGGGVRFVNPPLEELNRDFCDLQKAYEAAQAELTKAVIETCAGYVPALLNLSERLGALDVLTSFAMVASSSSTPYARPQLFDKGTKVFELIECRHPVIEQAPNMEFIPNDTRLGSVNNFVDTENNKGTFVVLTGANMGGKSTYLRANALAVFMAQIGCFVSCTSARFSLIDGIFTRVGAGDFQSKGVSTFMAEMMDCATIFETATENSLIIIDELGRGTSTYDGFGLAWAIAEEIIQRIKCFCLFATHFHELGRLQKHYPKIVENFKVETIIDEDGKLTILYQVVPGVADRSFGLNIAKLVGFPEIVIKDASKVLAKLEKV